MWWWPHRTGTDRGSSTNTARQLRCWLHQRKTCSIMDNDNIEEYMQHNGWLKYLTTRCARQERRCLRRSRGALQSSHCNFLGNNFSKRWTTGHWTLDQFTKTFFWNFQSIRADLCYILIYKQMLEKAFCSNIAPSLSSGNHLFYKAEYMGRSCPNQVWTITFDWSALATWNKHFQTAFW